jgi:hypothetical protein
MGEARIAVGRGSWAWPGCIHTRMVMISGTWRRRGRPSDTDGQFIHTHPHNMSARAGQLGAACAAGRYKLHPSEYVVAPQPTARVVDEQDTC